VSAAARPLPLRFDRVGLAVGGARVLDGLDFAIGPAERVALVGPSGAGKSLVVRLALGLVPATSGRIELFGTDPAEATPGAVRRARARAGFVLQGGSLLGELSVEDNLLLGFGPDPIGGRGGRRLDRLLLQLGIEHLARRPAAGLSAGERIRVELARGLLRDPELLILDDPLAGAGGRAAAIEELLGRQIGPRRRAMLLVTEDEALAARLAERVVRLQP
jgi:ABC-type glutathione transport system ATPase component